MATNNTPIAKVDTFENITKALGSQWLAGFVPSHVSPVIVENSANYLGFQSIGLLALRLFGGR
ncbi:MAG TPA: hypothetical protein VMB26_14255 [Candidatus Binataceae bacterium]|nr:hypothetical protein [Candidatus Binataceae bacterium]